MIQKLSQDATITIRPADKGGGIVIQNYRDYALEIQRQLDDVDTYQILKGDPTMDIAQKIQETLTFGLRAG
ncbi:Hypothetical predicted protein, partial [Pelobates cultripes]